jgi:hypothetical protein
MRCMPFLQWDAPGRSPNLRYGKARGPGPPRRAWCDATHARRLARGRRHPPRIMRAHDDADHSNQIRDTLTTVRRGRFSMLIKEQAHE